MLVEACGQNLSLGDGAGLGWGTGRKYMEEGCRE